jgi:hypothetical protein
MSEHQNANPGARALRQLAGLGSHAAAVTLRPLSGAAAVAVDASISLERRAVDRVLDSAELERLLLAALNSPRIWAAVRKAVESDGAKQVIEGFFDSGLWDEFVDRLLASRALWRLIDEVADSPAVTAAITQQSLGFADQVGEEVRTRSRGADDWLERAARRLTRRRAEGAPPVGQEPQPDAP